MKLYFNGCSFTYGDGIINPSQNAWPSLVSKKLHHMFTNDAVSGGSNDRIVYRTIKNVDYYDKFFIAWTSYSRFTKYNPVDNFEINFNPNLNLNASLHHSDDLKLNYNKYKDFGNMYYKYWYNELYEFKNWLQQIILLQRFLESKNKDYIMMNMLNSTLSNWLSSKQDFIANIKEFICFDQMSDEQIFNEFDEINQYADEINKEKFINWGGSIGDIIIQKKLTISISDSHPSIDGHKFITKLVLENL